LRGAGCPLHQVVRGSQGRSNGPNPNINKRIVSVKAHRKSERRVVGKENVVLCIT
jgi:hypothetical protein